MARQEAILEGMKAKGFASFNIVLELGSFTYEYVTRDNFGFAMKATYGEVNGMGREIFKSPKTDDGTKLSAKGLLQVTRNAKTGQLQMRDGCTWEEEATGELKTIFKDGKLVVDWTLAEIRARVQEELAAPHLKIDVARLEVLDKTAPLRILCRLAMPADLLLALYAKNTLDYLEFTHIELHVSYLMAARMDRVMQPGEPFSLKVTGGIINSANFKKIRVFDPHSEVTPAIIDRCYSVNNHAFVKDALDHYLALNPDTEAYCLVSPDAGALKKIHSLARNLRIEEVVECMKERDVKTGALLHFQTATECLAGKTCFIVDDICDGGGTFIGTAKMLLEKGAEKIVLIVSHGIFSKGTDLPGVDAIYTTDSFRKVSGAYTFEVGNYL